MEVRGRAKIKVESILLTAILRTVTPERDHEIDTQVAQTRAFGTSRGREIDLCWGNATQFPADSMRAI